MLGIELTAGPSLTTDTMTNFLHSGLYIAFIFVFGSIIIVLGPHHELSTQSTLYLYVYLYLLVSPIYLFLRSTIVFRRRRGRLADTTLVCSQALERVYTLFIVSFPYNAISPHIKRSIL